MGTIDKAAFVLAQSAHEQQQSTTARASAKLEQNKERRAEVARAQEELDARRLDGERMQDGERKTKDGDWVKVSPQERQMGLAPSSRSLDLELRRIASDEKKLSGELEILRREGRATMGQLTQAQERCHRAKNDAEGHARDAGKASAIDGPNRTAATGSAGDGRAAEVQMSTREIASGQRARAAERLEQSTARIEEKIEEAHEAEHDAIDEAASGGFFSALFGAIAGIFTAVLSVVTFGVGSVLAGLATLGTALGVGTTTGRITGGVFDLNEAQATAEAETALVDKAREELSLRDAESTEKRAERVAQEVERQVSELRRAKEERRG